MGEYITIAAINRCVAPCSKSKLGRWFEKDWLSMRYRVNPKVLNAQTYCDHFQYLTKEVLAQIELALGKAVVKSSDFKEVSIERRGKIEKVFTHTCILPISNLGDVKTRLVKNKENVPVKAFIVSNNLKLSGAELIKHYKERWAIETDYKDTKQYFGLGDFHVRKKEGIHKYLTLCFLVSTYLEYLRLMGIFGHYYGTELDLSSKGKQVRAYQHVIFERFLTWVDTRYKAGKNLEDLLIYFRGNVCSSSRKNIRFLLYNTQLSLNMAVVEM